MENNLSYFQPQISDIHIGYECEIKMSYNKEWIKIKADVIYTKLLLESFYDVRTPYLTKEQIEKEGWKHIGGKLMSAVGQEFEYKGWNLTYSELNQNALIERKNYIRDGTGNWNNKTTYFRGKLNSINEFRYVCKLLKIDNE